jgi:hypothetical protein
MEYSSKELYQIIPKMHTDTSSHVIPNKNPFTTTQSTHAQNLFSNILLVTKHTFPPFSKGFTFRFFPAKATSSNRKFFPKDKISTNEGFTCSFFTLSSDPSENLDPLQDVR